MLNKSNKHIRKLRFGSGTLRITQNGRTGPNSLKRRTVRLSELQCRKSGEVRSGVRLSEGQRRKLGIVRLPFA